MWCFCTVLHTFTFGLNRLNSAELQSTVTLEYLDITWTVCQEWGGASAHFPYFHDMALSVLKIQRANRSFFATAKLDEHKTSELPKKTKLLVYCLWFQTDLLYTRNRAFQKLEAGKANRYKPPAEGTNLFANGKYCWTVYILDHRDIRRPGVQSEEYIRKHEVFQPCLLSH